MKQFFLISAILLLTACSPNEAEKQRFVTLYTNVMIARELEPNTTQATLNVRELLAQAGYTEESFRAEFDRYARSPETLRTMLDSARLRARTMGDSLHRVADSLKHTADSVKHIADSLKRNADSIR
jgi:hypothetical protein